jgi:hypothetical protein
MIKKLISLILALALISAVPSVSFAFSDTDGTDYEEAVYVLSELDIIGGYEDKTFRPENSITRAEFAAMVVRLVDTSVYNIPEGVVFKDVGKKHWAYEFVNAGFHIGYFSGYGDGIFAPDEKISFSEVVKTVTTILGYKPLAEARGGYPTGYVMIANEKDLLDGLSLGNDEYVTRGDVALLLYNSLNKPKLEQSVFGNDKIEYTEDPRRTILTDELKVSRYEGVITATRHTGLYGVSALSEDEILIGDTKLAVGKSDIVSMLGYNLVVYAKEDKKTKDETVLFYEIKEENDVTTVVADDIDPSTNLNYFSYWNGEKQESIALSNDVQFIINAKYEPFALSNDLKPTSGTVTLLNNDGDKSVDVVIVKKYSHYVVSDIDSTDLVIYDKYGKEPLELEPADKNVDYKIIRNGSNAKFKNINIGAILSVLKSVDGEYMEINLVVSPIRGKVTGKVDSETFIIGEDGKEYKRSSDLPDSELIELGYDGTFYLDLEGRIIKIEAGSSTDGNYCYLMDAGISAGLGGVLQFKILNAKGEIQVLSSAEKVSFNGVSETRENILSLLGGAGTIVQQPIRFGLNSEGRLSKIEIPTKDFDTASRYYRRGTKMFGYRGTAMGFFINSEETVMFQVPTGGGSDDSYRVIEYDDLANYDVSYSVTGYDLEGLTVSCAVVDIPESVTSAEISGACCVVTSVTRATNKTGDPCYKIYYMAKGKKADRIVSDKAVMKHYNIGIDSDDPGYTADITAADLKPGDVIHVKLDANDNIISVARVLSVGGTNLSTARQFLVSRGFSAEKSFGVVQKRVDGGMILHIEGGNDYIYDITKPSGGIHFYDSRTQTVKAGTYSDIIDIETNPGDPAYAYVRCGAGIVNDVIVFYQSK